MKKCSSCGFVTEDTSANFCPTCGCSDFTSFIPKPNKQGGKLSSLLKASLYPLLFIASQYVTSFIATVAVTVYSMGIGYEGDTLEKQVADIIYSNTTLISLISNILFIVLVTVVFLIRGRNLCRESGARKFPPHLIPLCAILGYSMQYVLSYVLALISMLPWTEPLFEHFNDTYAGTTDSAGLGLTILSVSVVTGITEELVFRALPMSRLRRAWGPTFSVILTALVFGIAHVTPIAIFYATLLGLVMGAVYNKYGSLWPCAIVHIFFNLASILGLPSTATTFLLAVYFISFGLALLTAYFLLRRSPATEE